MGVQGLWSILHPCARPIKLDTLNRKRLAVDASIWIYQFLKAVRDKEGNALRNSHVVGFFRRICKLLFFGIKPVFVFDGGAPALKRNVVRERKRRREGRREDAVRTAGRLLAVQMQRAAEVEEENARGSAGAPQEEEAVPDEALVYVDEIGMNPQQRQQSRKFKKKDQYHLPDLDVSLNEMSGPNDPRVMSLEELQQYAKQFSHEGEEDMINVYDFSKIDYDSPFFTSLPASDRYNILNAARLRSRLRMGHSKEQLESMFPDRMAFSRFQIDRVRERNELTQRLMHLNDGGDIYDGTGLRVAGERGREYVLVKNDGVEGGWALGVISDEGTKRETAIDVDEPAPVEKVEDEEGDGEEEFEDVPIEGLNRLPKRRKVDAGGEDGFARQRQAFYQSRRTDAGRRKTKTVEPNPLFVTEDQTGDGHEDAEGWEEVDTNTELFGEAEAEEDEELQRAIAMSLENGTTTSQHQLSDDENSEQANDNDNDNDNDMLEAFQQSAAPAPLPIAKGSGRAIANIVNKRAFDTAPESREVTSFGVPTLKAEYDQQGSDGEEDEFMDLQAALAESRRGKRKATPPPQQRQAVQGSPPKKQQQQEQPKADTAFQMAQKAGFSGPLPFEKLDLGTSLLGKKKMQQRSEEAAGGFVNPELGEKEQQPKAGPLPPWFSGDADIEEGLQRQREIERVDREKEREFRRRVRFDFGGGEEREREVEVIDLDAEDRDEEGKGVFKKGEVIDLEADDEEEEPQFVDVQSVEEEDVRMDDLAEKVRVEPPVGVEEDHPEASETDKEEVMPMEVSDAVFGREYDALSEARANEITNGLSPPKPTQVETAGNDQDVDMNDDNNMNGNKDEDDEMIEWSESEDEKESDKGQPAGSTGAPSADMEQRQPSRSPSFEADFEDVTIPDEPVQVQPASYSHPAQDDGVAPPDFVPDEDDIVEDFDDFSDPEDEQLLRDLTIEAEEHARFASTLNNKSQAQNIADYERELKQLRNQQKKDRRDADEVTHIMIGECQQLLRLFGLPYVTAPMEAEAQCAELVRLGLVDGIVTDDSDCFLFGGTRIYKNMFNQEKFVECYLTSDLEKEFDLTREKLIQVAHLLGSDYTEGLAGVGPVIALEILSEFRTLAEFKEWWTGVQMGTIPKSLDASNPFRKKFRKNATKIFLPPSFPDPRIDLAYQQPEVDSSPEAFQWGVPDLDALRSFLMATIGWSQERTDEVLVPVIRDMNRRADEGTQSNITAFFDGGIGIGAAGATKDSARGEAFAPRRRAQEGSKRMGKALTSMAEKARRSRGEIVGDGDEEGDENANVVESGELNGSTDGAKKQNAKKMSNKRKSKAVIAVESDNDYGTGSDQSRRGGKKREAATDGTKSRKKKTRASDED